jgi:hypothetical protein
VKKREAYRKYNRKNKAKRNNDAKKYREKNRKKQRAIVKYLKILTTNFHDSELTEKANFDLSDPNYGIDSTHANWDTWIDKERGINVKYLGSVSEWYLDRRMLKRLLQRALVRRIRTKNLTLKNTLPSSLKTNLTSLEKINRGANTLTAGYTK